MLKQLSTKERDEVIQNFAKLTPAELKEFLTSGTPGIGRLYAAIFDGLRVYQDGDWYIRLDSGFWEQDKTGRVKIDFGEVIPELLSKAHKVDRDYIEKTIKNLQQMRGIRDALNYAQSKLPYPGAWDDLESDALIACENGIITKSGTLRDPKPTEYARRKSPVEWQGIHAPAPLWEKTISEILDGDSEMIGFIQRLIGYIVSGQANEKIFPVFYGPAGNNGKSVLLGGIENVLGDDYAMSTEAAAIMANKYLNDGQQDKPNQFLYELQNKRLLLAHEALDTQVLDENVIKQWTGMDRIKARAQRGRELAKFRATHTTILLTNNLPVVKGKDDAIWSRVLVITLPFSYVITPTKPNERKRDKDRYGKILKERAGIMAWIVRGWLDYKANGLQVLQKVKDWSADYRDDQKDAFDLWIVTLDTSDPGAVTASDALYTSFDLSLSFSNNGFGKDGSLTKTAFGRRMKPHFEKKRINNKVHYIGVKI